MRQPSCRVALGVIALFLAAGLWWWLRPPGPERGINRAIERIVTGVESGRISQAGKQFAGDFAAGPYGKREVVQGLLYLNRGYQWIDIVILRVQVKANPDQPRLASAEIEFSINAQTSNGRMLAWGTDQPVRVHGEFRREGRRWKVTGGDGLPEDVFSAW